MNEQARSIKNGAAVMMAMSIYALVIAVTWIAITEIMFVSDFAHYTGQEYSDYLAASPKYAEIYIITKKLLGIELLSTSVLMLFITKNSYSKGEKWSWYALLVCGIITWGSLAGYRVAIGYFKLGVSSMTFVIGGVLLAIGLAIPAKTILSKVE